MVLETDNNSFHSYTVVLNHKYIHTYIHINNTYNTSRVWVKSLVLNKANMNVRIYICIHTCIHTCILTYVHRRRWNRHTYIHTCKKIATYKIVEIIENYSHITRKYVRLTHLHSLYRSSWLSRRQPGPRSGRHSQTWST